MVAVVLLGGCEQDRHDRFPVERGGYEHRDRDHTWDGDNNRDRDHNRDGDNNRDRDHNWDGDNNRDRNDNRNRDDNQSPDGYRDRDNSTSAGEGYHDRDGSDRSRGRDDGERAIVSYVEQHQLPVRITNIEQLPAEPGTSAPAFARYRVSVESTGPLKTKADRIVTYYPNTGELSLER